MGAESFLLKTQNIYKENLGLTFLLYIDLILFFYIALHFE